MKTEVNFSKDEQRICGKCKFRRITTSVVERFLNIKPF